MDQELTIKYTPITELIPAAYNPRKISELELSKLINSIQKNGFIEPCVVNKDHTIIGGHQRVKAASKLGMASVPCIFVDIPKEQEKSLNLALNRIGGEFETAMLAALLEGMSEEARKDSGFEEDEITDLLGKELDQEKKRNGILLERFLIPPFSVLDTRQGYWQDRKRTWISMGIESEVGRDKDLLGYGHINPQLEGTSIFDPVLCEVVYRWFSPLGAKVLDPFAGGSVRGITAARLGREYTGVDLRAEQIESNREQAKKVIGQNEKMPRWEASDSLNIQTVAQGEYDMIFSCPPYADLEVYSDLPNDLSTMEYDQFKETYRQIIARSVAMLKENRFACFVVGDVRSPNGTYRNFVSDTIQAFKDAGMELYNEMVIINAAGTLPYRVGRQFEGSRKIGKMHQNALVFWKGDPDQIAETMGDYFAGERKLAEAYSKVLIFLKGDPVKATIDAGPIKIDDEAFLQGGSTA